MIQIQATFKGYSGKACSLFSAYDLDKKVLIVGAESDYRTDRRAGCIVLTNDLEVSREVLFKDEDLIPAIAAFYTLKSSVAADGASPRMHFAERAKRASPESAIEKDGLDANGPRFRIAEGVTCGQVAALATCLYVIHSSTVDRAIELASSFRVLARGGILTI
ncbi:hypothetical protein BH10PSE16_BH10PSE16_00920 [soil metagenome]